MNRPLAFSIASLLVAVMVACSQLAPTAPSPTVADLVADQAAKPPNKPCHGKNCTPSPTCTPFSLQAKCWTYIGDAALFDNGGPAFDFPTSTPGCGSFNTCRTQNYVWTTSVPRSISGSVSMTLRIDVTGAPVFNYQTEPGNTCTGIPASARPFFMNDNQDSGGEFNRWWANPDAIALAPGTLSVSVPLTPDRWSSVFGKRGTDDPVAFAKSLSLVSGVGYTLGGGCFFGHGVFVESGTGTARVTLTTIGVS